MAVGILQPIEDSPHSAILPVFETALRSGKYISIDAGALPVALDGDGTIYHGSFDKNTYRTTGALVRGNDGKVDTTAFEIGVRLVHYIQSSGSKASLSLALWDVDGASLEQRKTFAERLVTNQNFEAIPEAYKTVASEVLDSKQARKLFAQIRIMPQSMYEHSMANRWRHVKRNIREAKDPAAWAQKHFDKTGQIFLEAWDGDINFSFVSTAATRHSFTFKDLNHATEKVRSEGALPIALADQTLCGPISGGRMNEMHKYARTKSVLANQNGVFTINIQDVAIDTDSLQKMARGVYFQELGENAGMDKHAAYIFSPNSSGQIIQLPEVERTESFSEALKVARTRIASTMDLEGATVYGTGPKREKREVDEAIQKAARARFAWIRNFN